jgi:DNA-binding response OmpR family regulator
MSRFTVLHIDDDPNDAFFVRRAFSKANLSVDLQHVADGSKAVAYLRGEGSYADRKQFPLPSVVLLDIKLPVMDGFEILSWLRQYDQFRGLTIFILSSSDQLQDRVRAQQLGADRFFVKSPAFKDVIDQVGSLLGGTSKSRCQQFSTSD